MSEGRDELAQALVELQAVQRVAEDVISSRDLDDVLARCIDHTRQMADTTSGAIYLRDERRGVFQRLIARETVDDQAHLPIEQIETALTGRNYFVADLHNPVIAWHPAVQIARARGFRIVLNLGMRWRGRLIGLLILAWRREVTIPESTLHTLEALMGYQAAAIENARTRMLLETRARLAQALLEFSGRALTTTDEQALQQLILDTACSLARGDGGVVAIRHDDRFRLAVGRNANGPEYLPATDPLIAAAVAKGAPLLFDAIGDAPADSQITAAARVGGYSSIAIMPLQHGGSSTGLLIVALTKPHQWNSEEVEALQTLAQVSSEALERCRIQLAEARERRRLDLTLEHLPIGVVVIDGEGRMLHNNRASTALGALLGALGGTYQEGMRKLRTSDGAPAPAFEESLIGRALRGELTQPHDADLIDASGRRRVVRSVAAPLHEPGQPPVAVLGFSEVTELYELAAAKDRFLRIASHELRSPVTALRATAQLLKLDPTVATDEARRRLLHERIDRQSERLANLVAQLLDSARLSADSLPLELEEVDFATLAREMADEAGPRVRLVSDGELRGRCDRARIEQVLANLLSNALQYSAADAPVELVLGADDNQVRIEVRDHGVGIAADEIGQVFAPFYRSAHSSGRHNGMGLGLHITSEIVHRHRGTIRVVSEPGVGSTFFVELPRARRDD
jgi:signal transduction histidine kinase/transcriptional regulator with GAF, ATPase, and Fis domain